MITINISGDKPYKNIRDEIGQFLFSKRKEKKWTLSAVAKRMKIPSQTLENIELGRTNLKTVTIVKLLMLYQAELKIKFIDEQTLNIDAQ